MDIRVITASRVTGSRHPSLLRKTCFINLSKLEDNDKYEAGYNELSPHIRAYKNQYMALYHVSRREYSDIPGYRVSREHCSIARWAFLLNH